MVWQTIVGVLVLLALMVVTAHIERRQRRKFRTRFPPLSDAEFVARCGPGTRPEVALKVRRIVSQSLGVEYERIYPEARLVDDLGAN